MTRTSDGLCECDAGYFMDANFGCLTCQYMVQGCKSCSIVNWNTGLPLDNVRKYGPDTTNTEHLVCDSCTNDDRFVEINLNSAIDVTSDASFDYTTAISSTALPAEVETTEPIRCESCYSRYDGCSKCGTFGDSCTGCQLTHTLITDAATSVSTCTRCDFFM